MHFTVHEGESVWKQETNIKVTPVHFAVHQGKSVWKQETNIKVKPVHLTPFGLQCLSVATVLAWGCLEKFVNKWAGTFWEALCVCLSLECDETLHVDSIHSTVCLCVTELAVVMETKSSHVEKGDNLVNTFKSFFTHMHKNRLVHLTWLRRYFQWQNHHHLAKTSSSSDSMLLSLSIASSRRTFFVIKYRFLANFSLQISIKTHKMRLKQSADISRREVLGQPGIVH